LKVPDAVATPLLIVHEVATNTAGFSPAVDSGTEVCTGIVIDAEGGVLDGAMLDGAMLDGAVLDGAVLDGAVLDDAVLDGGLADARGDTDGDADADGDALGEADAVGGAGSEAFRPPACLPKKNAATQRPIRKTNPATVRRRLVDGFIALT
jgi:hypothetical protein